MSLEQLDEDAKQLLLALYRETGGNPSVQVSMYETGASLGLDREAASRMTEDLIGWEMVELLTLSGGIGISEKAVKQIEESGLAGPKESDSMAALGSAVSIDTAARQAVEHVVTELKSRAGALGLDIEILSEVMADLKTIDAQLDSPRPKTAVLRECFRSLRVALEPDEIVFRIDQLLKE